MEPADGAPLAPLIAARNYTGLIKSLDAALAGATPNPAARAQLLINRGVCLHALGLLQGVFLILGGGGVESSCWRGTAGGGDTHHTAVHLIILSIESNTDFTVFTVSEPTSLNLSWPFVDQHWSTLLSSPMAFIFLKLILVRSSYIW